MPNNTQSFPGGGSGAGGLVGGSSNYGPHPFGPGWKKPLRSYFPGGRGAADVGLAGVAATLARSGIFARPTLEHPDNVTTLHGHIDPNNHFAPKGGVGGGAPVNPFAPFMESHLRARGPAGGRGRRVRLPFLGR